MADSYDDFHFAQACCYYIAAEYFCLLYSFDKFYSVQDYPLQPFLDDCSLLGSLLDDCLRIEVGEELFEKVSARLGSL